MKILFISLHAKPGFELTDILFANHLKKSMNFNFAAIEQSYYDIGGFFSYDKNYKKRKDFNKLNTIWVRYPEQLKELILEHDLIIMSPIHGSKDICDFAKEYNKKVILIDSAFNYDYYPNNKADLIFFKGENSKKVHLRHQQKYLKKSSIINNGGLQGKFIQDKHLLSKKDFFKKYKIKKKNIVMFLPTGPQHHTPEYLDKYYKICSFILKKNFHLILKLHPSEYNKNKITMRLKDEKSASIFKQKKNISICTQDDFYSAIKYSKHIFAINTTSYVEVNLMNKPIIFIDRLNFFGVKNEKFYIDRGKIGIHKLIDKNITKNKLISNMDKEVGFKYYGKDIQYEDLQKSFKNKNNKIDNYTYKKLLKNNDLYFKNFYEKFYTNNNSTIYENIVNEIESFIDEIKLLDSNQHILTKIFFKFKILIRRIIF